MNRASIVTNIRQGLGYNNSISASIINTKINEAQEEIEKMPELPWFLRTEISSISTAANEERVPVPANFIRRVDDEPLYYYDTVQSEWNELIETNVNAGRAKYKGVTLTAPIYPVYYALDGVYFRIFPTPDDAYELRLTYFKSDDLMDSDSSENDWAKYFPWLLIGKAGMLIAGNNRDKSAFDLFSNHFNTAMDTMIRHSEAREHEGKNYVRGGDD